MRSAFLPAAIVPILVVAAEKDGGRARGRPQGVDRGQIGVPHQQREFLVQRLARYDVQYANVRAREGTIAFHLTSQWTHVRLCSGPAHARAHNL